MGDPPMMMVSRLALATTLAGGLAGCVQPPPGGNVLPGTQVAQPVQASAQSTATLPASLDQAGRTETQAHLQRLGYEIGTIDGVIGPQTQDAIRTYQSQTNRAVDGQATPELLVALREAVNALAPGVQAGSPQTRTAAATPSATSSSTARATPRSSQPSAATPTAPATRSAGPVLMGVGVSDAEIDAGGSGSGGGSW